MPTTAPDDPRHLLFALCAHLMTQPSRPLPPAVRAWLLAGMQAYLAAATPKLDDALGLRTHGKPSPARQWRQTQRDRALRNAASRLGATPAEIQSAIRRQRRRSPARHAPGELDQAIADAARFGDLPESIPHLRRILRAS